jgi:hypothetical protein
MGISRRRSEKSAEAIVAKRLRSRCAALDAKGLTERRVHVANLDRLLQMSASAELREGG